MGLELIGQAALFSCGPARREATVITRTRVVNNKQNIRRARTHERCYSFDCTNFMVVRVCPETLMQLMIGSTSLYWVHMLRR